MELFKKVFQGAKETTARLTRDAKVQKWLDAIDEAGEREKKWRKEASRIVTLYEQEKSAAEGGDQTADFNILYANTETLAPAVYNNTPRPIVKRKIDKENPIGIAAAQVLQRVLAYQVDTANPNYTPFDELQKLAVLEALVPGRGLCRFSYDADTDGQSYVKDEAICGDAVPWDRVRYGYAKQYADIPWLAYEHFMTREECVATFGEELGKKIALTHSPATDSDKDGEDAMPADAQGTKFAHIWEVWDKSTRKQIFLSEGFPNFIQENPDPLGLEGFFNSPRPIQFITRIKSLVPNTLYLMYEQQAKELDDVTRRIGSLTRAMKIRGMYDSTIQGIDTLLKEPENTFMPATNVAAMLQGQTLEKAMWFLPIDKLIAVLQQLYLNRAQVINTIHQLTGIADIMRGASAASETLGAQKMKEAWGTIRLKRMQKEVQRFTRDCFRMQAELAAKKFSIETLQQMTGLKFPRAQEQQMAQQEMQMLMMEADRLQAMAQSGQPVTPGAAEPLKQKKAQLEQVLNTPSWEAIKELLSNDTIRNFAIDIETNSTLDIEATEDKGELAEILNSMGQVFNGVWPMVEKGVLPFDAAKALCLNIIQKFRMSEDVEEVFRKLQQPPPRPDPAAQKVEMEMKRDAQKFEMEQKAQQQEQQNNQAELELKKMENNILREKLMMEAEFNRAQHQMKMQQMQMQLVAKTTPQAPVPAPQGEPNANV